ncbi:MAG: serine/threonine protein kinase [Bifidobacteriaceae bacterium]|jgi:serine/threonine protein kinase|nr:serine/threonine protein kinase [Bifidobacteriaceae bacterium]
MGSITLPIGTELGGYVLSGVIGSGASGTVYRAKDADNLTVALKLLHPHMAANASSRQRLRREVRAQRSIRSPFVAQVVDAELDGAEIFIVTELVEGVSLARDITDNGPWAADSLAALALDLDEALDAVHQAQVVHRDIKPSNVVLSRDGRPVLIDFGIAQDVDEGRLTGTGLVAGTPGFVAPDLLRGGRPTPQSDRWAAVALLLNAATGRQPFGSGAIEAVLARVIDGQADVEGLPEHIAEAFLQALRPDPDRRLSLTDLAHVISPSRLSGLLDDEELPPTRLSPIGQPYEDVTEHLWTKPPVMDYRAVVARSRAPEPAAPPVYPPAAEVSQPVPDAAPPPLLSPYPPAPKPTPLVTGGLAVVVTAAALYVPVVAAVVAAVVLILVRSVWVGAEAVAARRFRRGWRGAERARTALGLPWYLARGTLGASPALVLGLIVGWGGYLLVVNLMDEAPLGPGLAALAVAAGLVTTWWGPSGLETRRGSWTVIRWLAPSALARVVALVAAGAAAALMIILRFS